MSTFQKIFSLPIILVKTVWRFILVTVFTFPISGFFIVPAIVKGEADTMITTSVILLIITMILNILVWKHSYENIREYDRKWRW